MFPAKLFFGEKIKIGGPKVKGGKVTFIVAPVNAFYEANIVYVCGQRLNLVLTLTMAYNIYYLVFQESRAKI
mgnify:CR=1 FL=1